MKDSLIGQCVASAVVFILACLYCLCMRMKGPAADDKVSRYCEIMQHIAIILVLVVVFVFIKQSVDRECIKCYKCFDYEEPENQRCYESCKRVESCVAGCIQSGENREQCIKQCKMKWQTKEYKTSSSEML
ncbi:uncharacterized protein LOC134727536 [Mytilus trossulus]|uniref:uncharacterized protein LOC134727536 n=1 Tax=Mytilus trossulus TaxID=6551 RepID=UPI0030060A31